jgi:hypothetical protein
MSRDPRTLAQAIHSAIRLGRYLPITARIRPLKKGKKSKRNRIVFIKESSLHPIWGEGEMTLMLSTFHQIIMIGIH